MGVNALWIEVSCIMYKIQTGAYQLCPGWAEDYRARRSVLLWISIFGWHDLCSSAPWPISISYPYVWWAWSLGSESLHLWVPTCPCCGVVLLMKALQRDCSRHRSSIPIKKCKLNKDCWPSTYTLTQTGIVKNHIHYTQEFQCRDGSLRHPLM